MARLMSSTELQTRVENSEDFVLIDVLPPEEYEREHIPGAINIPLDQLAEQAKVQLNKNQRVVVYGRTHDDESSHQAAEILEGMNFRKISDFDGGLQAWKRAGFLTEGTNPEIIGEMASL